VAAVRWLTASAHGAICDECIGHCNELLLDRAPEWKLGTPFPAARRTWDGLRCLFCGTNVAAQFLRGGQGTHICDRCVVACNDQLVAHLSTIPGAIEERDEPGPR
jgi:ATP-dependent protease Clp ATPase subunit